MAKGSGTPAVWTSSITKWVGGTAVAVAVTLVASTTGARAETRTLEIYNIHTKETTAVAFKKDGRYVSDGLKKLNHVMRDWRLDIATKMDPELFDVLWELKNELGATKPIYLISGHRSEKTNNMLRRTRGGQAKKSQHIVGTAADVFFPGVPLERLRNAALVKQKGGVGYYPRSGQPFVHVDTGRVRHWPHIPEKQLAAILKNGVPKVPVRAVEETAVAVLDAPAPSQKPVRELDTQQPMPIELASASTGESVLKPSLPDRTVVAALAATPTSQDPVTRSWGESWLTPSRPDTSQQPRNKPSLVAGASSRTRLSSSLAPSSAVGYAAPGDTPSDAAGRLLSGASTTLAGRLADAERLSALASLGADPEESEEPAFDDRLAGKVPAPLSSPQAPSAPSRPIYTASLSPGALLPLRRQSDGRFRAVLFAPAHEHVFEPAPEISENFVRTVDNGGTLAFSGGLFADSKVGSFTPIRLADGYEPSSLRVVEAGRNRENGIVSFAKRAISWLIGS